MAVTGSIPVYDFWTPPFIFANPKLALYRGQNNLESDVGHLSDDENSSESALGHLGYGNRRG